MPDSTTSSWSDEEDVEAGSSSSRGGTPDPAVLETYQRIMTSLLPPPSSAPTKPAQPGPNGSRIEEEETKLDSNGVPRAMTKAEKQNAKKKRRKERERDERAEMSKAEREAKEREEMARPVSFRLFSSETKDVSLLPSAEDYPLTQNPRHIPLSSEHVELIRRKASAAAITLDPSTLPLPPPTPPLQSRRHKPIRTIHIPHTTHPTPICIIQPSHSKLSKSSSTGSGDTRIPKVQPINSSSRIKRQRTKRPVRVYL